MDGAKNSYKTDIAAVRKSRDQTFGMLSVVSDSVDNKRKFLEDTVSRLTSEVGVAIEQGCSSVYQTSYSRSRYSGRFIPACPTVSYLTTFKPICKQRIFIMSVALRFV